MPRRPQQQDAPPARRRLWWRLAALVALGLLVWVGFFDSHSVQKRLRLGQQRARLAAENDSLRRQIETLEAKVQAPPSDSTIERIAREEYGMRRPGETVYRLEERGGGSERSARP